MAFDGKVFLNAVFLFINVGRRLFYSMEFKSLNPNYALENNQKIPLGIKYW